MWLQQRDFRIFRATVASVTTLLVALLILRSPVDFHPREQQPVFRLFVLGAAGGPVESRVSGYLLQHSGSAGSLIGFDCGVLRGGLHGNAVRSIRAAIPGAQQMSARDIHQRLVNAYLISHTHLDHIAGLSISSADELPRVGKPIIGIPQTIQSLRVHIFNGAIWPDMPSFGFYRLVEAPPGRVLHDAANIPGLDIVAFEVSHGPGVASTCFLVGEELAYDSEGIAVADDSKFSINANGTAPAALLCGDLGADSMEKTDKNSKLWHAIAELVERGRLRMIMMEASFVSETPARVLYGHLTPRLLLDELRVLTRAARVPNLDGVVLVVHHIKEADVDAYGYSADVAAVEDEVLAMNDLGLRVEFAHKHVGGVVEV